MEKPEPRIRGILRRILVVTKWTIGGVFVLCVLLVAINFFDEELSPEAKALLTAPSNPYRPEENLYLALLGFEAKEDESPVQVARERVSAYEKEVAAALKDPPLGTNDLPDAAWQKRERLEFRGKVAFCEPLSKSCLAGVEAHAGEIGRLLQDNRELYRRYVRLRDSKGYHETATPTLYLLIGYPPRPVRQLYLANIALRTKTGDRARRNATIADLLGDIRVWRLQLAGTGSLIPKMIAVANLQGDYALLGDIIADRRIDLSDASREIRTALESPEDGWKIGGYLPFEFRSRAYIWNQMPAETSKENNAWWEHLSNRGSMLFFKLKATQNFDAKVTMRQRATMDAEPAKLLSALDDYHAWARENLDMFSVRYAYNPIGKVLVSVPAYSFEGYALRVYDGAAFQRMVRLGYEIRTRGVRPGAIPAFMQQNPQWASHPVDGRPFNWDEKRREIAVQPRGQQPKDRRFSIPVWSPSPT